MAALSFKTTDIPATNSGRVKTPNPYLPHAQAAVKARGERNDAGEYPNAKAIQYTLTDEDVTRGGGAEKAVKYLTRKLREAGEELDVTIRVKDGGDGSVTLWATDRITRKSKNTDADA